MNPLRCTPILKTDDVAVSLKEAEAKLASIVNDAATRIEIVTQRFA